MRSIADVFRAFKAGAGLRREDVDRLLRKRGMVVSNNRLQNFSRNSDRGGMMTVEELYQLVSAWADERRAALKTDDD